MDFNKISANGNDLIYVSKNVTHTADVETENVDEDNLLKDDSI